MREGVRKQLLTLPVAGLGGRPGIDQDTPLPPQRQTGWSL